jgi:hypothetical protein
MRKFVVNSPAVVLIKIDSPSIRLDHPKTDSVVPTVAYLTFGICQQLPTDASPAAHASNPQVGNPFIPRHHHAHNLFS